jgi:hypothetical protein
MRHINRMTRVIACSLAALIVTASAFAQSRRVDGGSTAMQGTFWGRGDNSRRFAFYWETQLTPPTPPMADGSFFSTYDDSAYQVHRMLMDRVKRVYFGYTVQIEPQTEVNTFRLTFQPLSLTPALRNRLGDDAASWKALPSAKFPAPQVIRAGEVLELGLLSNTVGQRLTEYVTVQEPPRRDGFQALDSPTREFSFAADAPHDFGISDVALRLQDPRVFINGKFEESSARSMGEEAGGVVWIYIPTRGRFLMSVVPNPKQGFNRAGEIRGNSMHFAVGGNNYSVTSGSRIAPGIGAYNLYVLHQPDWRPTYANANVDVVSIGSADSVDYILGDGKPRYTPDAMRDRIRK